MESQLSVLHDRVVRRVVRVEEYIQLYFERGSILNIFNSASFTGPAAHDIAAIEGKRLIRAEESGDRAILRFEDGSEIEIDLRDEAFTGPEAMELRVPGEPIVVWN